MLPKLVSPAVQHGTGDAKFLAHGFLRGITLHAFEYDFQFKLRCIVLPLLVHVVEYLSLFHCPLYQVLDNLSGALPINLPAYEIASLCFCFSWTIEP